MKREASVLTKFRSKLSMEVKDTAEKATEEDWIGEIIKLLSLDKRSIFDRLLRRGAKYEYLLVLGGVLLHIKEQGVVWLPKPYIKGLLSKAGISSTMMHKLGSIFSFTIPGGGFLGLTYNFLKDRVWKKPPTDPIQYLPRMIDRVEYGPFTIGPSKINVLVRPVQSIVKLFKKKKEEAAEEEPSFHIYFIRFIGKIDVAKESEKRPTLVAFTNQLMKKFQRIPTFKCRDEKKLSGFIEGLEKDGFKVVGAS